MSVQQHAHKVRLIQHNCARNKYVMHSILETAVKTSDILLLQEPWIGPGNTTVGHPSFISILPGEVQDRRSRVAIFISRLNTRLTVNVRQDLIEDPDILALEVTAQNLNTFTIINVYNEQIGGQGEYTVERLLKNFSFPKRCLLLGDFNAHSFWWNSSRGSELRSEVLVDILQENNFDLLNEQNAFTHFPSNGNTPSVLDLTFASPPMFDQVSNWCIDPEADTGSDHSVIRFEILSSTAPSVPNPQSQKYNWKKADWENVTKHLKNHAEVNKDRWKLLISHSHHHQNLDLAAELLQEGIQAACNMHVPLIRLSPRSKVWWNEELTENRKTMKQYQRRYKLERTPEARADFNRHRNCYFRAIQDAKSKCWDIFLSEAKGKEIYTAFRYTKPRKVQMTPAMKKGNEVVTTVTEV